MQPDQQMVKQVLRDTIASVCDSLLSFSHEVKVEGMLGISVDNQQMITVHVLEGISKDLPISTLCGQCGVDAKDAICINKRLSTKPISPSNITTSVSKHQKNKSRTKRSTPAEGKVMIVKAEVHNPPSLDTDALDVHLECCDGDQPTDSMDSCNSNFELVKNETTSTDCVINTIHLDDDDCTENEALDPSYSNSNDSSTYTLRKRLQRVVAEQTGVPKKNGRRDTVSSNTSSADEILPLEGNTDPNATDNVTYGCHICGKHFNLKGLRNRHVKQVHNMEKNFPCSDCDRKFFDKTKLFNHCKVSHQGYRHKCPQCAREFRTLKSAKQHISLRKCGTKKFKCGYCDTQYNNARSYKLHMQCHIDTKFHIHQCSKCHKKFQTKHGLKGHLNICGSTEKPFRCQICDKDFAAERYMKEHLKIHTSPMRYECTFCDARFNYRRNLLCHKQKMHPESVLND